MFVFTKKQQTLVSIWNHQQDEALPLKMRFIVEVFSSIVFPSNLHQSVLALGREGTHLNTKNEAGHLHRPAAQWQKQSGENVVLSKRHQCV